MEPKSLSFERCRPPLFECPRVVVLKDGFVKCRGQPPGEHIDGLWAIDVVLSVSYELFKLGNILVKVLPLHFDSLA